MHMHVLIHIHTHMNIYIYMYIYIYMCTYTRTCMHTCIHACMHHHNSGADIRPLTAFRAAALWRTERVSLLFFGRKFRVERQEPLKPHPRPRKPKSEVRP